MAQGSVWALGPDGLPFAPDRSCLPTAPKGGLKPGPGPDRVRSSGANARPRPVVLSRVSTRSGVLDLSFLPGSPSRRMPEGTILAECLVWRPVHECADGVPDSWADAASHPVSRTGGHHCTLRMKLRPSASPKGRPGALAGRASVPCFHGADAPSFPVARCVPVGSVMPSFRALLVRCLLTSAWSPMRPLQRPRLPSWRRIFRGRMQQ